MPTIKDIANRLGVSVSTVSKGLNNANDISEELKEVILDTAVEMGYSTKRSKKEEFRKLCLFITNMKYETADSFGYDIILGFKQNAFRHNWDVSVIPITPKFQQDQKYDTYLLKNGYCGAFLLGLTLQDPWMEQLKVTTMPTVLFDNFIEGNPYVSSLGTDNYEGIRLSVKHLVDLGHKKIGFINGPLHSLVSNQRQEAYENAMKEAGLTINEKTMARAYFIEEAAKYHFPNFLEEDVTAIICGNDLLAKGVIDCCQKAGRKIPEDISIIGFDDIPLAAATVPPLTTIAQQRNALGKAAYIILNALIHHISISQTLLRPKLVKRESTGTAPFES